MNNLVDDVLEDYGVFGFRSHCYPTVAGMWLEEIATLIDLAASSPPGDFLEIGSHHGSSAVALCLTRKHQGRGGYVYSNDIKFNPVLDRTVYKIGKFGDIHRKLEGSSVNLNEMLANIDTIPKFSFVLCDGWHSFRAVLTEFFAIRDYLTTNAIIAFHDVAPDFDRNICEYLDYAHENYDNLMATEIPNGIDSTDLNSYHKSERLQDFMIGEAIAYILNSSSILLDTHKKYPCDYSNITGPYKHGSTSPYNSLRAIKIG